MAMFFKYNCPLYKVLTSRHEPLFGHIHSGQIVFDLFIGKKFCSIFLRLCYHCTVWGPARLRHCKLGCEERM